MPLPWTASSFLFSETVGFERMESLRLKTCVRFAILLLLPSTPRKLA
jgi:hypothetical protein